MEKNPLIIWAPTALSKKVVLYNAPSPLAYSTPPSPRATLIIKHGRVVFLKEIL